VTDLREVSVVAPTATSAEVDAKIALLLGSAAAPPYLDAHDDAWWMRREVSDRAGTPIPG
jgi:hypothetical protein